MNNIQTLTSLAMLKVDIDTQHRNYVDYLSPFVIDVLNADKGAIVSDIRIADKLRKRFGLQIPAKVVQHVLRRLQKNDYLVLTDGVLTVSTNLPKSSLAKTRASATAHIEAVLQGLVAEAKNHKLDWSKDDANKAVVAFLGKFTVDCLKTYVFNTALPNLPQGTSSELYIVGKFIQNSHNRRDEAFESFIVLVKGLMYSNALLCPDLESLEKKFQNVVFYLDTPLILNLLGLQDQDSKRAANELVALLIKLKGSVAVFAHTLQECQNIIGYALANIENPRATSRVLEEMRRSSSKLSDLTVARENIDEAVKQLGVKVHNTPDYLDEFQIDELELETVIQESNPGLSEAASKHDINSIRSIFVLRKGKQPVRLEDSGAVFVTLNQRLARAAYHVGRNHNSSREVSPAITAYSLANIAWLKSPVAAPLLPLHETMALSYAALEPSTDLFKKYVVEMDLLLANGKISTREHEILRLSPPAREELMELTLGDEHALTASSISSILANIKTSIIAEHELALADQLRTNSIESAVQLSELQKRETEALDRALSAESQLKSFQKQVEYLSSLDQKNRELRLKKFDRIAKLLTRICLVLPMFLLLFGALAGASLLTPGENATSVERLFFPGAALVAVAWGVYSWYTGTTVRELDRRIRGVVAKWIARTMEPGETL
ncbi:MAG: hypothetical protein ACXW1R_07320 [Halobacteriota archaeon]